MGIPSLATVGTEMPRGYPGQILEHSEDGVQTMINQSATAIDLGTAVGRGTAQSFGDAERCIPVTAGTEVIVGISGRNAGQLVASTDGNNTISYAQNKDLPVVTNGTILVTTAEAVAKGDQVLFVVASNKFGSVATGALAGTTRVAVPNAQWRDTAASGGLARIRIRNNTLA